MKYRNISTLHLVGSLAHTSLSISSMNSFVLPYGFVADSLASSVSGRTSGSPYTVALDENTNRLTDAPSNVRRRVVVPHTLAS